MAEGGKVAARDVIAAYAKATGTKNVAKRRETTQRGQKRRLGYATESVPDSPAVRYWIDAHEPSVEGLSGRNFHSTRTVPQEGCNGQSGQSGQE